MAIHPKLDVGSFLFPVIETYTRTTWRGEVTYHIDVSLIYVENRRSRINGAFLSNHFQPITDAFNIRRDSYFSHTGYTAVGLGRKRIRGYNYDEIPDGNELRFLYRQLKEQLSKDPEERVFFEDCDHIHWNPFVEQRLRGLASKDKKHMLFEEWFIGELTPIPLFKAEQPYEIKEVWPS